MRIPKTMTPSARRREFVRAAAALGGCLLLPGGAHAAQIKALKGSVTINGKPARLESVVKPGDLVATGAGGRIVFTIGEDAFLLREKTRLELRKGAGAAIAGLRVLTGALLGVFGKGARQLSTPTATIGIRGTGIYIEASREVTYLCTCYGDVEVRDSQSKERRTIFSGYHTPSMIYAATVDGRKMSGAEVKNHSDDELIMLEALVGRTSPVKERAKLRAPEPDVINAPRSAPAQPAAPPPAPEASVAPAVQPAPAPAAAAPPSPAAPSAPQSDAPLRSDVLDWRLPPPKELPRR